MSKLDDLIRELCPHGIKYTELRDVCDFQNGFSFKSALFKEIGLPILRITNIQDGNISASDYVFFDREDYKESLDRYKVKKGDIVVAMSGATTGKIGYYNNDETLYLNQRVGLFKPNEKKLNRRFLFHWLCTKSKEILNVSCGSGAQPNLSSNKMMSFCIPIPPLPVQEEIVRILDNFTELTARRKQYEYYRDKLLRFDSNISFKRLGDFSVIKTGKKPKIIETEKTKYEYINAGTSNSGYANEYNCEGDVVTTPSRGQGGIGFVGYQSNAFWLGPLCYKICSTDNKVLNKYLYYFLSSNNYLILANKKEGGTPAINSTDLSSICIPIPSFEEQQRIVDILDRFDKLCNDISEGLPAEIEARQKQYEYYRDKLLTFKPLEEVK